MRFKRYFAPLLLCLSLAPVTTFACGVRDFLTLTLPETSRPAWSIALELAYPGLRVDEAAGMLTTPSGHSLATGGAMDAREPDARLEDSSITEQFAQIYPLGFDLASRETPWVDPGRARNEAFFLALYGASEAETREALQQVAYPGKAAKAEFLVSKHHCAAEQLRAALAAIAARGPEMDPYLKNPGGSFNWRVIAGTKRLSGHSFGMAVDFNADLGGYWRWSGEKEGAVGAYSNRYPEALVSAMERYGYIWGGKWHHYDGMHFEYRPELILYSRLVGGG